MVQFMRGEGNVASPFIVDESEDEYKSYPESEASVKSSPQPSSSRALSVVGPVTSGQRASRRDGKKMTARQKMKRAMSVKHLGGPRPQSPISMLSSSPPPQPLVPYEGRLVPIEVKETCGILMEVDSVGARFKSFTGGLLRRYLLIIPC